MNIFATSPDPMLSAFWLDDQRLVKMAVESAQILATVRINRGEAPPLTVSGRPYRKAHPHHPCTLWAAAEPEHEAWLEQHLYWLGADFEGRFGKVHASVRSLVPNPGPRPGPLWFPNAARNRALGLDFTADPDTHRAYRAYLNARWALAPRPPRWTRRRAPPWCTAPCIDDLRATEFRIDPREPMS